MNEAMQTVMSEVQDILDRAMQDNVNGKEVAVDVIVGSFEEFMTRGDAVLLARTLVGIYYY